MGDVEQKPELTNALGPRVQYPDSAKAAGISGTVYLRFIVEKDGSTSSFEVLRSPHRLLTEETKRVVRTARFEPGRHNGKLVRVRMALPMRFAFEKSGK